MDLINFGETHSNTARTATIILKILQATCALLHSFSSDDLSKAAQNADYIKGLESILCLKLRFAPCL